MIVCECGRTCVVAKNGAKLYNSVLTHVRRGDAYECECGKKFISGWGRGWVEIQNPNLNDVRDYENEVIGNYNSILQETHRNNMGDRPFCLIYNRLMKEKGEGVIFLRDWHAYQKGIVYECNHGKIIKYRNSGWGPPISEEEIERVKEKYKGLVFRFN